MHHHCQRGSPIDHMVEQQSHSEIEDMSLEGPEKPPRYNPIKKNSDPTPETSHHKEITAFCLSFISALLTLMLLICQSCGIKLLLSADEFVNYIQIEFAHTMM